MPPKAPCNPTAASRRPKWTGEISLLSVGYGMALKAVLKTPAPSMGSLSINDEIKLVGVITAAMLTKDYLVKMNIIPENVKY